MKSVHKTEDGVKTFPEIEFTLGVDKKGTPQSKVHTVGPDGQVVSEPPKFSYDGELHHIRCPLDELLGMFEKDGAFMVLGTPKGSNPGDTWGLTTKGNETGRTIARTLDHFEFAEGGTYPLLIDIDIKTDNCIPPMQRGMDPLDALGPVSKAFKSVTGKNLNGVAAVFRSSASSGLKFADGTPAKDADGWHIFLAIKGKTPHEVLEFLHKRMVVRGSGYAYVTAKGTVDIRTYIDAEVGGPSHPSFEGPPVLKDGLTQDRTQWGAPGRVLDLTGVNLTTDEAKYTEICNRLKSDPAVKALSAKRKAEFIARKVAEAVALGLSEKDAKNLAKRMASNQSSIDLYPKDKVLFRFDDGREVTIVELLADPGAFHGKPLADPTDEKAREGKAKFFWNQATELGPAEQFVINLIMTGQRIFLHAVDVAKPREEPNQDCPDDEVGDKEEQNPLPPAIELAIGKVAQECGIDPTDAQKMADFEQAISLKRNRLAAMCGSAFAQSNSKYVLVTDAGEYRVFTDKNLRTGWVGTFGAPYNSGVIAELVAAELEAQDETKAEIKRRTGEAVSRIFNATRDYVAVNRQFSSMAMRVGMFTARGSMKLDQGRLSIIVPHREFREGPINPNLIGDYKQHWPMFDEFIDLLAAARFASARKKAFVWIHADSDWGKNLLDSAMKQLGIRVEVSVAEIEKLFSGQPVSKQTDNFLYAWALVCNEWKAVKGEIKMLEQEARFGPKNQLEVEVNLYLKMFLSAEDVPSLASDGTGIEDQFANRFSLIRAAGTIHDRPLFLNSRADYLETMANYLARELNRKVREYVALGERGAANAGDAFLDAFHKKHGIANSYERLSVNIKNLCRQHLEWIGETYLSADAQQLRHSSKGLTPSEREVLAAARLKDDKLYIKDPARILNLWMDTEFNQAERGKLAWKREAFAANLPVAENVRFPVVGQVKARLVGTFTKVPARETHEPYMVFNPAGDGREEG